MHKHFEKIGRAFNNGTTVLFTALGKLQRPTLLRRAVLWKNRYSYLNVWQAKQNKNSSFLGV